MELILTFDGLLNMAGGLLWFLEGAVILAIARRSRRGRLVGGFAATFGLAFAVQNLFVQGQWPSDLALAIFGMAHLLVTCAFVREEARGLAPKRRLALWVLAAAAALPMVVVAIALGTDSAARVMARNGNVVPWLFPIFLGEAGALGVLLATLGSKMGRDSVPGQAKARSNLALFFGLWFGFYTVNLVTQAALGWTFTPGGALSLLLLAGVCVASLLFLAQPPSGPVQRRTLLAIVAAGLGGLVYSVLQFPPFSVHAFGGFGIVRTVGAVFLALAVLRDDLLGVALPAFAVKRGVAATAALASLFIVAQVAQNFLSARYGLLTGGIIAGAVLFAANPIQKSVERAAERKQSAGPRAARDLDATARREALYREALRIALVDRKVSRQEEEHLFALAEEMGIGAGRAMQLRNEVTAEAR